MLVDLTSIASHASSITETRQTLKTKIAQAARSSHSQLNLIEGWKVIWTNRKWYASKMGVTSRKCQWSTPNFWCIQKNVDAHQKCNVHFPVTKLWTSKAVWVTFTIAPRPRLLALYASKPYWWKTDRLMLQCVLMQKLKTTVRHQMPSLHCLIMYNSHSSTNQVSCFQ